MASGGSTPAKKKRSSWNVLLRNVNPALIPESLDLEKVLSDDFPSEGFIQSSIRIQQVSLEAILGNCPELIESIIESVKQRIDKPYDIIDQLRLCWLAPSSPLDERPFTQVVNALFSKECVGDAVSYQCIYKAVFSTSHSSTNLQPASSSSSNLQPPSQSTTTSSNPNPNPNPTTSINLTPILQEVATQFDYRVIRARQEKEANGTPLLGLFTLCLANELAENIGEVFKLDMQFPVITEKVKPGAKPACDGAICAIVILNEEDTLLPVILYEYKPKVDTRTNFVDHHHLMEMVIQGYYCLHQYKTRTIIQCLTDLFQFYYFKVDVANQGKVKFTWYKSICENSLNVESHLNFLLPTIKDMVNKS